MKHGGFVSRAERFDSRLFGSSVPVEVGALDPQQRLLEGGVEALPTLIWAVEGESELHGPGERAATFLRTMQVAAGHLRAVSNLFVLFALVLVSLSVSNILTSHLSPALELSCPPACREGTIIGEMSK